MVRISLEASFDACLAMASGEGFEPLGTDADGCTRGRILMASWREAGWRERDSRYGKVYLFVSDIVYCQFDFAHAPSAESLRKGVVTEHSGRWTTLLRLPVLPVAVCGSGGGH